VFIAIKEGTGIDHGGAVFKADLARLTDRRGQQWIRPRDWPPAASLQQLGDIRRDPPRLN
jgi:hypothetical protein